MRTSEPFRRSVVIVWLGLSHLSAAACAAAACSILAPAGLSPAWQAAAGALMGLAAGLLASLPLLNAIETASAALGRLAHGKAIAPLADDWQRRCGPLGGLLSLVDALGGRERELARLRDDLVRTTGQAAALAERNRLARDLHDSIKQQLYAIQVGAAAATARWESDAAGARAAVEEVRRAAQAALAEMAALLRQLHPAPVTAAGLRDALGEQCEALAHRTGAAVAVDLGEPADAAAYAAAVNGGGLPPGAEEVVFRVAQEALNNIARHARAGHAALRLRVEGEALRLEIVDDGQGFVPGDVPAGTGYGLPGMRERAAAIGAALDVTSAPGAGTRVALAVPLGTPAAAAEGDMSTEARSAARAAGMWRWVLTGAALSALAVLQALVPRLVRDGGPSSALAIGAALLLACLAGVAIAWSRAQRASLAVTLACGAESPAVWRMRREDGLRRFLVPLFAILAVPGTLVPKSWLAYPAAALASGLLCALLATIASIGLCRAENGYLRSLPAAALAAELDQEMRRQYGWVAIVLATLAGYYGIYGGFRSPSAGLPWHGLVPDMQVVLFCSLLAAAVAARSLQMSRWRKRRADSGAERL